MNGRPRGIHSTIAIIASQFDEAEGAERLAPETADMMPVGKYPAQDYQNCFYFPPNVESSLVLSTSLLLSLPVVDVATFAI